MYKRQLTEKHSHVQRHFKYKTITDIPNINIYGIFVHRSLFLPSHSSVPASLILQLYSLSIKEVKNLKEVTSETSADLRRGCFSLELT